MMRPLPTLALCAAVGAPAGAMAQDLPALKALPQAAPPAVASPHEAAPPPFSTPVQPAPPAQTVLPPPSVEAAAPPRLAPPTTVAPVLVETEAKGSRLPQTVGGVIGGLVGGTAGAAVAGPVGKIAGGLVGKTVAKKLVGGGKKKDIPAVEVAEGAPAAAEAAPPPR